MKYLFEIIGKGIKKAFAEDDAVGVSVVIKIAEHQEFIDAVAELFNDEECYLVIEGANERHLRHPKNIHLSGVVEKAVEWRNLKKAQGRIIFNCAQLRKRTHSLNEFYKITHSSVVKAIAKDQALKAPNVPVKNFWEAIVTVEKEGSSFALKNVLKFLDGIAGKKTGLEKELCALRLIPDKQIFSPSAPVVERIMRNYEVIEQLNSMDDSVRKRMSASLVNLNKSEKKRIEVCLSILGKETLNRFVSWIWIRSWA